MHITKYPTPEYPLASSSKGVPLEWRTTTTCLFFLTKIKKLKFIQPKFYLFFCITKTTHG
nr:MAG TPA: hypothetical protein [Caudoviricetes sp.]